MDKPWYCWDSGGLIGDSYDSLEAAVHDAQRVTALGTEWVVWRSHNGVFQLMATNVRGHTTYIDHALMDQVTGGPA